MSLKNWFASKQNWLRGGIIGGLIGGSLSYFISSISSIDPTGSLSLLIWLFIYVPILGFLQFFGIKFYETTSKYTELAIVVAGWFAIGFLLGSIIGKIKSKK